MKKSTLFAGMVGVLAISTSICLLAGCSHQSTADEPVTPSPEAVEVQEANDKEVTDSGLQEGYPMVDVGDPNAVANVGVPAIEDIGAELSSTFRFLYNDMMDLTSTGSFSLEEIEMLEEDVLSRDGVPGTSVADMMSLYHEWIAVNHPDADYHDMLKSANPDTPSVTDPDVQVGNPGTDKPTAATPNAPTAPSNPSNPSGNQGTEVVDGVYSYTYTPTLPDGSSAAGFAVNTDQAAAIKEAKAKYNYPAGTWIDGLPTDYIRIGRYVKPVYQELTGRWMADIYNNDGSYAGSLGYIDGKGGVILDKPSESGGPSGSGGSGGLSDLDTSGWQ